MTLRIGFITQWFDPEGSSAAVPGYIARSLHSLGAHVEVLTGFPNYPEGKIFTGYRQRLHLMERMDGINVHRVPLRPSHSDEPLARALTYASFAASSLFLGLRHVSKVDAYLVYSTPVTAGLAPALAGRRPIVTYIEDLWPDTMFATEIMNGTASRGLLGKAVASGSNWLYGRSSQIAVISPGMKRAMLERGFPQERLHLVPNWLPDSIATPSERTIPGIPTRRSGCLRFIYAGNFGPAQAVMSIIEAARLLADRSDVEFLLVGSGILEGRMREEAERHRLAQVHFLGRRPNHEIPHLVAQCDAQLITLSRDRLLEMTIPSKIQYSLAFGRPIVAAVSGDPAQVLEGSKAAMVVQPGSGATLAAGIRSFAMLPSETRLAMGTAGRAYFEAHFSEKVGAERLLAVLELAAGQPSAGRLGAP